MRRHILAPLALAVLLAGCGTVPATSLAPQTDATAVAQKTDIYKTIDVLGIGPVYSHALKQQGINRVSDLLEKANTRTERAQISRATGISPKLLLTWVNHADLMRITQVGPVYSRMLEDAGVDTVAELARRDARNLAAALQGVRTRSGKTMVERVPALATLETWITRARENGRFVEY